MYKYFIFIEKRKCHYFTISIFLKVYIHFLYDAVASELLSRTVNSVETAEILVSWHPYSLLYYLNFMCHTHFSEFERCQMLFIISVAVGEITYSRIACK